MHRKLLTGIVLLCSAGGVWAQPLSINLPGALAGTRALLDAGGTADILVIGDSLSFRAGTWIYPFRDRLHVRFGDAGFGYQSFSPGTGAMLYDGWTTGIINGDVPPFYALDGLWSHSLSGPSGQNRTDAVFTGESPLARLHYRTGPGAGSFRVTFADGSEAVVSGAATQAWVGELAFAYPTASRQVGIQPLGDGPVVLLGQVNSAGAPGVRVHRAANGGWGVDSFLHRDATFDGQVALIAPSLVYIWLGQNSGGLTPPVFAAKISSLIDRVLADAPGAGIVLVGTHDSGWPGIAEIVGAMYDAAAARGVGFINLYSAAGTHVFQYLNGYRDGTHFSPAGGEYIARLMFDAFVNQEVAPFCGPEITSQPPSVSADPGGAVVLTVGASATTALTYRWRRNDMDLSDDARISGVHTPTLTIVGLSRGDTASYRASVSTWCGTVLSDEGYVHVMVPCPADINEDGFLDGMDYDQFNAEFESGGAGADYNDDGFVDGIDYDRFNLDFAIGC